MDKTKRWQLKFDASVNNQAQATAKYGSGATDLGKSGVYMNGQGNQVNLNADGTATSSTMLSEVTVSAKTASSMSATDQAMGLNDATGITGDLLATTMDVAQSFDKAGNGAGFKEVGKALDGLGQFTGAIGAFTSISDAVENPSTGNLLKAGVDASLAVASFTPVGLLSKPLIGVVDGILGASGVKDAFFKGIDNQIDKFKSNQVINAQSVEIRKIRIK